MKPLVIYHANSCLLQSEAGNALAQAAADRGELPVGIVWFRDRDMFQVSLRSVGDFDVSTIAKQYGGGGHKNAAGFRCKVLPWA